MSLNGALVRSDNSDGLYKAILTALAEKEFQTSLTYPMAIEALSEMSDYSRRADVLREASLRWAFLRMVWAGVAVATVGGPAVAPELRRALAEVGHRVEAVEGKRRKVVG